MDVTPRRLLLQVSPAGQPGTTRNAYNKVAGGEVGP